MKYLLIVIFFVQGIKRTWTEKKLTLQTGGSVTILCHYDRQFIQHKKYWCYHAYAAYNFCKVLAYANTTDGKVTVTDNPAQSFFNVTMRDLEEDHTGTYWCAVEIGGIFQPDVTEQFYFTVTSGTPDNDKTSIRKITPQTRPGTKTTDNKKTSIRNISPHTTPAGTHSNTTENKEQTHKNMEERITVICSLMGVGLLLTVLVCSICMSKRKCKVPRSAGSAQTDTHTAAATPPGAHDDIIYTSVANR
ncbi:CMRF35-like molecule 8 isoform X2 [Brachyhypopomus gauderio]|uniref:CMRF35-like molecule 8 isoform X2 n=1 Tax=Brachyhypopomus gauderio TaxID=698409 RepID=UPI004042EFE4